METRGLTKFDFIHTLVKFSSVTMGKRPDEISATHRVHINPDTFAELFSDMVPDITAPIVQMGMRVQGFLVMTDPQVPIGSVYFISEVGIQRMMYED